MKRQENNIEFRSTNPQKMFVPLTKAHNDMVKNNNNNYQNDNLIYEIMSQAAAAEKEMLIFYVDRAKLSFRRKTSSKLNKNPLNHL